MVVGIICVVVAIILTAKIGNILFRNTVGTGVGYAGRYIVIFVIILAILAGLCQKVGLL